MKKSNEKELEKLPKVDYTKLPEEVEEAIADKLYEIKERAKLTWDGRQFLVRIPSEITQEMGITKENKAQFKVLFRLTKPSPDSIGKAELKMELVKDGL